MEVDDKIKCKHTLTTATVQLDSIDTEIEKKKKK